MNLFDYKPHELVQNTSTLEIRKFTETSNELLLTVEVRSSLSIVARNAATIRDKVVANEKATEEEKEAANAAYIASLVDSWIIPKGQTLGEKRLECTPDNAAFVATSWPLFSNMVVAHATTVTNYGDKAKKS
jgi:hypothetical protein